MLKKFYLFISKNLTNEIFFLFSILVSKKSIHQKVPKSLLKQIYKKDYQTYQKDFYLSNLRLISTITYSRQKIMPNKLQFCTKSVNK